MWIFTTCGFFSITKSPTDPGMMQIRARLRTDLDAINNAHGIGARVIETPAADYRWRLVLTPEQLQAVMRGLVACIDYENFKSAVHDTPGQEDKGGPYMRVWSVMRDLQDRATPPPKEMVGGGHVEWTGEPAELGQEYLFGRQPLPDGVDPLDNPKAAKRKKKTAKK